MKISVPICVHLWLISFCIFAFPGTANAQIRPVYDQGALGLGQLLKRLNTTASVMMIGAHPDDEDTALLAYLARGENARTAYLSLTRGDGGQNIIGPELGESLGIIRTEELLQARRLDGAEQYFTRAYDYGFSKTLDEAKSKWDEKVILCDVVQVIRHFRPLVVVSQFSGTPADGHGQHQYSGYISPLAVKAAADGAHCTSSGSAWNVRKFYVRHRGSGEPGLRINTGKFDFLLGRSYFEIAMEARSQHKSQEQGVLELKGDQFSGLNIVGGDLAKIEKETGIFDGIEISQRVYGAESAKRALLEYDPNSPQTIVSILDEGYIANLSDLGTLNASRIDWEGDDGSPRKPLDPQKESVREAALSAAYLKDYEFKEAIKLAGGIRIDALSDRETVVPGEHFAVAVKIFFPNTGNIKVKNISLNGCQSSRVSSPETNQNPFRREIANHSTYFDAISPKDAKLTQPYWLEEKRKGDFFSWQNDDNNQTLPFQAPQFQAAVELEIAGKQYRLYQPILYRYADDVRGEVRRNVNVVPAVSLDLDQELLIVKSGVKADTRRLNMTVTNNSDKPVTGTASLKFNVSSEWTYTASSPTFSLAKKGEKATIAFDVNIPANTKPGSYSIFGQVMIGESLETSRMHTVAYPHIQTHRYYSRAESRVEVMDLRISPVRIGYIAGTGDRVPDAIRRMGIDVAMLGEKDLSTGDLSKFDTIVVGIRASQVRPDFVANNGRLLDFVKKGGSMIVQYQQQEYVRQNLMPFPAKMSTNVRVVDENAPVTILVPDHPIFNFPNKIDENDWKNWVQERNLYTLTEFDSKYTALLESHDEGESESKGGLLVANVGKGKYVYCGYSMFRQLPAGVPGAYRLFANLLSLPRVKKIVSKKS